MTNCETSPVEEAVGFRHVIERFVPQFRQRLLVEDVLDVERVLHERPVGVVEPFRTVGRQSVEGQTRQKLFLVFVGSVTNSSIRHSAIKS